MHEAPGTTAAKAAQEAPPCRHTWQGLSQLHWLHSRQAHLPGAAVLLFKTFLPEHSSATPALFAGKSDEQAGPDISRLALHLQQEWDHEANSQPGSITITAHSGRKVWWSSGMCKTGWPHRLQAKFSSRSDGKRCPYSSGRAACPCNDLAPNHPEVAAEWDWEANGDRTPEDCGSKHQLQSSLEVWSLGAKMEHNFV